MPLVAPKQPAHDPLHLDLTRGTELSHGSFLRGLLARGALPRLETLDLTDDLHERLQSYLDEEDEDYDDDDRVWAG